jgi:hypothetical protein
MDSHAPWEASTNIEALSFLPQTAKLVVPVGPPADAEAQANSQGCVNGYPLTLE